MRSHYSLSPASIPSRFLILFRWEENEARLPSGIYPIPHGAMRRRTRLRQAIAVTFEKPPGLFSLRLILTLASPFFQPGFYPRLHDSLRPVRAVPSQRFKLLPFSF